MNPGEELYHITAKEIVKLTIANTLIEKAIKVKKAAEVLRI